MIVLEVFKARQEYVLQHDIYTAVIAVPIKHYFYPTNINTGNSTTVYSFFKIKKRYFQKIVTVNAYDETEEEYNRVPTFPDSQNSMIFSGFSGNFQVFFYYFKMIAKLD